MANVDAPAAKIQMEPVESSNLAALGYDPDKLILAVRFKHGDTYHYGSVTLDVMSEFYTALSKGQYFSLNIKGKFPGQKMTGSCNQCGAKHGWIGETCADCGGGVYEEVRR